MLRIKVTRELFMDLRVMENEALKVWSEKRKK